MTEYTVRLILVVKAAQQAAANQLASQPDTGNNTLDTFTVPLARPTAPTTPFAYWCGWSLKPAQATALRNRLKAAGMEDAIVTGAEKGTFQPKANAKAYVFDARDGQWTNEEVLAVLGLVTMRAPDLP